ncbi:hypothetical protein GUITHDRAFT_138327 [Guillardia theta CCMP2712]|uniref:Uncharacterized protein n=1 Tax=Guillardia theta (strain CCMP2712) TaxID=905079 RepID=L1JDL2_GUITC|nr:hypothetical protein GUITHDRAFT_138327 [Guillardia theta CCMP2712]EKX46200.1 hypothetical protein GUITHDRAFT_138327 [Guillardia theta CCMP2712]|eukprot:XP_005833180.1 hypothetical protein GUITHDRAFT_138327 [Guillardia theta CCMP2712]
MVTQQWLNQSDDEFRRRVGEICKHRISAQRRSGGQTFLSYRGAVVPVLWSSMAGAPLPAALMIWDMIKKDHDDTLAVAATDVTAANRWLCEIAGGKQLTCCRSLESVPWVFQFRSEEAFDSVKSHKVALKSVFRTPRVLNIPGPRGTIQLVSLGMTDKFGEMDFEPVMLCDVMGSGSDVQHLIPWLQWNRMSAMVQVQVNFFRWTEQLRFNCDNCVVRESRLVEEDALIEQIMDFWHADCDSRCLRAYVLVVDDNDVQHDEKLLRLLSTSLWDKPFDVIKQDFRKLCGYPIPDDRPSIMQSFQHALAVFKPGTSASQHQKSSSRRQEHMFSDVQYETPGCTVLRSRYNKKFRQHWKPRSSVYTAGEQAHVDFINGPVIQAMMKGSDTDHALLTVLKPHLWVDRNLIAEQAYRRKLGMELQPPKRELLDEKRDHLDDLLDAVLEASANDARRIAYYTSWATILSHVVDKFFWPGLYVTEKFVLTISFAASIPLVALAGEKRRKDKGGEDAVEEKQEKRRSSAGSPKFSDHFVENAVKHVGHWMRVLMQEDGNEKRGGMRTFFDCSCLSGAFPLHQSQHATYQHNIFLSPQKNHKSEESLYKSLKKDVLIQMLYNAAAEQNPEMIRAICSSPTRKHRNSAGEIVRDGGESLAADVKRRKTQVEKLLEGAPKEEEVHIGSERRERVRITVCCKASDRRLKDQIRYGEKFEGKLERWKKAFGGDARFFDGGYREITGDVTPADLTMEDEELVEAIRLHSSADKMVVDEEEEAMEEEDEEVKTTPARSSKRKQDVRMQKRKEISSEEEEEEEDMEIEEDRRSSRRMQTRSSRKKN